MAEQMNDVKKQTEVYKSELAGKKDEVKQAEEIHNTYKDRAKTFETSMKETRKAEQTYQKQLNQANRRIAELEQTKRQILSRLVQEEILKKNGGQPEQTQGGGGKKKKKGGIKVTEEMIQQMDAKMGTFQKEVECMRDDWAKEKESILEEKEKLQLKCEEL